MGRLLTVSADASASEGDYGRQTGPLVRVPTWELGIEPAIGEAVGAVDVPLPSVKFQRPIVEASAVVATGAVKEPE